MKPYDWLFFDLDGTLTDSGLGIMRCAAHALRHFGIEVSDLNVLRPFIGPPLEDSFQQFYRFSPEQAEQAVRVYRERYRSIGVFENEVYPGIPECLDALRAAGYRLALATSKPMDMTAIVMDHFDLRRHFDCVMARDAEGRLHTKSDVIREALLTQGITQLDRVLMIGDRKFDILGAHELGLKAIGVLYGYGDRPEMEAAAADHIVSTVGVLRAYLLDE